ncbi:MAG TPA: TraB/GumN family protein [Methylomirabilota bacterium]|nr:TraB/GumN family protein [Methylomirabilota bacterium]
MQARNMWNLVSKVIFVAAVAISATGCTSVHRQAERIHLSRHPIHEKRMSNPPAEGHVASGVWRIRGVQNTVYLVGTSHVVATNQIPFPSPFYAAYEDSREIYVEADPNSLLTMLRLVPKALQWVKSHQAELVCPKGRTVADYLSPATVERLRAFYGKDYEKKSRMTPLFLAWVAENTGRHGGDNGGVEEVFALLARKDGKPIRTLDDDSVIDVAVAVMEESLLQLKRDIAQRGADAVVEESILSDEKDLDDKVWRQGDLAALEPKLAEMKNEAPAIYEKLLPERNQKWLPKLKRALHSKRNVMVLVGVAHMGGKEGLLQLLQDAGFKPEQMYGIDRPDSHPAGRDAALIENKIEQKVKQRMKHVSLPPSLWPAK